MKRSKFRAYIFSLNKMLPVLSINYFEKGGLKSVRVLGYDKEFEIGDFEIMENTDIKDSNNTAIYEGDIIKIEHGSNAFLYYKIIFNDLKQSFDLELLKTENITSNISLKYSWVQDLENVYIIGNIFENQEFLI